MCAPFLLCGAHVLTLLMSILLDLQHCSIPEPSNDGVMGQIIAYMGIVWVICGRTTSPSHTMHHPRPLYIYNYFQRDVAQKAGKCHISIISFRQPWSIQALIIN